MEKQDVFQPMTLMSMLLLFHKTHLNLLDYERKPPDTTSNELKGQTLSERSGGPLSR